MHLAEESIDYQIKGKPKVYQTSQIGVVQTLISCVIRGRIYYIATVLLSALFIVSNVYPINSLFRSFLGIIPTNSGGRYFRIHFFFISNVLLLFFRGCFPYIILLFTNNTHKKTPTIVLYRNGR